MVPISAHALFARPMVVAPTSVLAVEVHRPTPSGAGVLWCDGRRTVDLPPGRAGRGAPGQDAGAAGPPAPGPVHRPAGGEVRPARSRLARRGRAHGANGRRSGDRCLRSSGSPRSASSTSRCSSWPGFTVDHRRDRCRQDDGRHRPRACCSAARADTGACAPAPSAARVEGVVRGDAGRAVGAAVDAPAARSRTARCCWPAQISAEGRSRAFAGGAAVPVPRSSALAERAGRRARPVRPAPAAAARPPSVTRWTGSPAPKALALRARVRRGYAALRGRPRPSSPRSSATARERAREADLLRFGLDEIEAVDPQPGEDVGLAAEESRLGLRRHPAHRRRAGA